MLESFHRRINAEGLEIIKRYEEFSAFARRHPVRGWVIGYGSPYGLDGRAVTTDHERIDRRLADTLLRRDVFNAEGQVMRMVKVPLTTNMFSALVSFAYSVGKEAFQNSALVSKLNASDYEAAADEFRRWRFLKGRGYHRLTQRRGAERALFDKR